TKVVEVVEEIDAYDHPVSPTAFFTEHPDLLVETERQDVLRRLEGLTRPVRVIDAPARPPRVVVSADGITIKGSVQDMRKVTWGEHDGGWRIVIDLPEE